MRTMDLDGYAVVETDERLDALSAPALKEAVTGVVRGAEQPLVIIDLAGTRFIDSSGCGALVAALRSVVANGGDMKICSPSAQARDLFELTRLDRVFRIFGSRGEAVDSFG